MKKLLLFVAVVFVAIQVEAQAVKKGDVPDIVVQNLESWYPGVSKVKWEMNDGMYVASFLISKMENEVVISSDGEFSSSEAEINLDQLPEAVRNYLSEHFPDMTFEEIEMEMDARGLVKYSVEAGNMEYEFSADGKLLSQESDDDDQEDDKD
jgi:hypothetical protein